MVLHSVLDQYLPSSNWSYERAEELSPGHLVHEGWKIGVGGGGMGAFEPDFLLFSTLYMQRV
jgi:hypothetical protein